MQHSVEHEQYQHPLGDYWNASQFIIQHMYRNRKSTVNGVSTLILLALHRSLLHLAAQAYSYTY